VRRLSSYLFLLGLAAFLFLLTQVDLGETWHILLSARPSWTLAAFLLIAPEVLFKGVRLSVLCRSFKARLSLKDSVAVYLAGQPLGAVTPAKLGDIVRIWGIQKWASLRPHSAFAVHVADKVFDLLSLGLLAATGLVILLAQSRFKGPAVAALCGIGLGILLMVLVLNPGWMRSLLKPLLLFLAPRRLQDQVQAHGREFYKDLLTLLQPLDRLLAPFLLSLGAWVVVLVRTYFCSMAVGLPIPFSHIALILPAIIVLEFLPVTVMGFGIREGAFFALFASPEVTTAGLLSFAMMTVVAGPLLTALAGLACVLKLDPSREKR